MGRGAAEVVHADRFEVGEQLGSGGMGVVYRAFDRRAGHAVALKTVRHASGRDLYRFKREFRSLANIVHPNLAALHELHTSGDEWFFTMELVDGVSFIDWVRPSAKAPALPPPDDLFDVTAPVPATGSSRTRRQIVDSPLDAERLAVALPQLMDAVLALHVCGKLHRDLKPSNVLVTPEGRVVVLDFGLVSDIDGLDSDQTHETEAVVGTPVYMSPEQGANEPLVPASDWYSVGVMLYEALTGRRPFEGAPHDVIRRKQQAPPVPPGKIAAGLPRELDVMCQQLLARAPTERPHGRGLLAALGKEPSRATLDLERTMAGRPFVGRGAELDALRRALADSAQHSVALFVRGESGSGKSRLVRHFIDEHAARALVLEGRCYERESVPFKTLDTIIDALTRALMTRPRAGLRDVIPRDVAALARLFPVLRRVPAIAERTVAALLPPDRQEVRRRAFAALRHLLARLAHERPLVVVIDDLQWGDADSAVFLAEVVHHPEPLPLLLLLVHQLEDDAGVVRHVQTPGPGFTGGDVRTLDLGPLPEAEALELARALGGTPEAAAQLVQETGGHPLFLVELARHAGSRGLTLEELVARRLAALPPAAAALARAVAVAARPLPLAQAAQASGVETMTGELALLRAEGLVRMRRRGEAEAAYVEVAHSRVRAAVIATMSADARRRAHEALARTLEAAAASSDDGDEHDELESLVAHWLGAEQPARAAEQAAKAARTAEEALAFARAAELYGLALRHGRHEPAAARALRRRRAEALVNAGQLEAGAAAFAEAAQGAPADEALECERLQLEQLLRVGSLTEGLALSRRVLAKVGHGLPASPGAAIRQLVVERVRLRLRGLGFKERAAAEIPAAALTSMDVLFSVASGLGLLEPPFGRLLQSRYLRAALEAGEPRRAAIALAMEMGFLGLGGVRWQRRVDQVAGRVRELAARLGDPYVVGITNGLEGLSRYQAGRWKQARLLLETGIHTMREQATGIRWELDVAEHYHTVVLFYLGEVEELVRTVQRLLPEAVERGDVYAQQALRGWRSNVAWLLVDKAAEARAHVDAVAPPAATAGDDAFHLQRYWVEGAHAHIDLYLGDAPAAWRRVESMWRRLAGSYLKRLQTVRVETAFLRARAALACGERAEARRMAARLEKEDAPWAYAFAEQVRAALAAAAGERAAAELSLSRAQVKYAACDMALHADVVKLRHADLTGGEPRAVRAALHGRGVVDPDATARMLCPWPT